QSDGRVRIAIEVPHITLTSPLPPIVNPHGVLLQGERDTVHIEAPQMARAPVIDLSGENAVIRRLEISGATGEGILVRGSGARVSEVTLRDGHTGIYLVDDATDLLVENSVFERNGT